MSNLLLTMSIIVNIFLYIHIYRLKKYIDMINTSLDLQTEANKIKIESINKNLAFISNNMDKHFDSMAGKMHMITSILQTGDKRKK